MRRDSKQRRAPGAGSEERRSTTLSRWRSRRSTSSNRRSRGRRTSPTAGLATALFLVAHAREAAAARGRGGRREDRGGEGDRRARSGAPLIRLQCYEGLDVAHAVYEWNYARQLLHIRAAQAGTVDEAELFGREFLIRRPMLEAIESEEPVVLLIDEIDRADEEFEAFLLEVLSDFQVTMPELGTIARSAGPTVILTSNRTRELHDALKRRCLYHWIGHPSVDREVEIVRLRVPGVPERLAEEAARFAARASSARPPEAAGNRRDDRLGRGADRARATGARRRERPGDPRLGTEVPRGSARPPRRGAGGPRRSRPRAVSDAVVRHLVVFGRVLREAGLEVGPGRVGDALRGLDAVDLARRDDVYWTLRQTLVSRAEDLEAFDRAFDAWFLRAALEPRRAAEPRRRAAAAASRRPARAGAELEGGGRQAERGQRGRALRTRDFAAMTPEEFARARRLIRGIAAQRPRRRSRRLRPRPARGHAGRAATRAASLSTGGDPVLRAFRSRAEKPRKLVLLLDVSGSMEAYSRALLLYLHAARGSGRGVETFAFGTRLTRMTRELATRDPETALAAAASRVRRLVGRHAHRRVAEGVQRRVGAPGADPGRGRRGPLRRVASEGTPSCSAPRWRDSRGRRSPCCGSIR